MLPVKIPCPNWLLPERNWDIQKYFNYLKKLCNLFKLEIGPEAPVKALN
jgi:hypothetical protein